MVEDEAFLLQPVKLPQKLLSLVRIDGKIGPTLFLRTFLADIEAYSFRAFISDDLPVGATVEVYLALPGVFQRPFQAKVEWCYRHQISSPVLSLQPMKYRVSLSTIAPTNTENSQVERVMDLGKQLMNELWALEKHQRK